MGLFQKKTQKNNDIASPLKILGSGCSKCNALEANTREALKLLGKEMPIAHVTDFAQIASYGVMTTPVLVYENQVCMYGRVATPEEIAACLKEVLV